MEYFEICKLLGEFEDRNNIVQGKSVVVLYSDARGYMTYFKNDSIKVFDFDSPEELRKLLDMDIDATVV